MILETFVKSLIKPKQKSDKFYSLLSTSETKLNLTLLELYKDKDYNKLQDLEQFLRTSLLKTLEIKGSVGTFLMKKDFEMNKDLIMKLQEQVQNLAKEKENPHPRFGLN